jgi:glycosyltransferase involved in cell wall biosynthesis
MALREQLDPTAITLLENVPRERVLTWLQAADIFALASLHEMMPIAVLEALACGLPIVCNADQPLLWMVGDAGRPTDISQPGGLAAQFTAFADPALRRQFAQAARLRAEQLFSEDAVVAQYLEMYRAVAAAP